MKNKLNHITVFEHESIKLGQIISNVEFNESMLKSFQEYFGNDGVPYFSLINKGIQFNEHVGVIHIGNTLIEVLPKVDKKDDDKKKWREILIDLLKAVNGFEIKNTSSSDLRIKPNTILDFYFELFIREAEYLLHTGLIKKYRKKERNVTSLKGSLMFNKQIQLNLTHQERFYVRHTVYDKEHQLHFILYKTIKLLDQINTNIGLKARIGSLMLNFPEMPEIKVNNATFDKIIYTRKNLHYKNAIAISKLLLLKYHPDVSRGENDVLALMFDMNLLWEEFVYVTLRKKKAEGTVVLAQKPKYFWKPEKGRRSTMKPDIWIKSKSQSVILDTKWKNLNGYNPSPEDLRQMYVYHEYYQANKVVLVYPYSGEKNVEKGGRYSDIENNHIECGKKCSVVQIAVQKNIKQWQISIQETLMTRFPNALNND